jgi:hypothetical protein
MLFAAGSVALLVGILSGCPPPAFIALGVLFVPPQALTLNARLVAIRSPCISRIARDLPFDNERTADLWSIATPKPVWKKSAAAH